MDFLHDTIPLWAAPISKVLRDLLGLLVCVAVLRFFDRIRTYNVSNLKSDVMSGGYNLFRNLRLSPNPNPNTNPNPNSNPNPNPIPIPNPKPTSNTRADSASRTHPR